MRIEIVPKKTETVIYYNDEVFSICDTAEELRTSLDRLFEMILKGVKQ